MDPEVFDRLQFWEYLNLMEVCSIYFCRFVGGTPTNIYILNPLHVLAGNDSDNGVSGSLACAWPTVSS
jgi:hypothetical protein